MNYSEVVLTLLVISLIYPVLKVGYFILMNIFFILNVSGWFFFHICLFLSQVFLKFFSCIYRCYDFLYLLRVANILILYPTYVVLLFVICLQYLLPDYRYLWLSFLIFFFLFVSECQFSTFSFPISICAHLFLDIMWFFLIRQKNWRGTENASFIFYPWQPVNEGVAWLRTLWLSCVFFPFHSSGNDHVSPWCWVLAAFFLWFPEWSSPIPGASAPTRVQVLLFSWWIGVGACLVPSLSCVWSHSPADSQL